MMMATGELAARTASLSLKERVMVRTSETGRLCMNAASNVVGTIADHNFKSMKLSADSTVRSCEYVAQLAGAKTGLELLEFLRSATCFEIG
jgi:hypothetical protein